MRKIIIPIVLVFTISHSCRKRIDNFLYNPTKIENQYQLENADVKIEDIGSVYDIPEEKIHVFTLPFEDQGETITISAIYVGEIAKIATDTVILYCHGNRGNMDYYWPRQKLLANIGGKNRYGVLQIDYPGYGMSEGTTSEENMYSSVRKALDWLKSNGLTSDRLIMYGFSLGTASVCELTSKNNNSINPSKIILEAPFASAEVMIQDAAVVNFPGSYFVNLKIDNAEEIKNVKQPFLWLHGIEDHFLSMKTHGEIVFKNYKGSYGEAVRVPNGDHSTVPMEMGYTNYLQTLEAFIQK